MESLFHWIGEVSKIINAITVVIGLGLAILNFLRDKPKIKIDLQWDLKSFNAELYDPSKLWGVVSVTNIGRRPIFVSHLELEPRISGTCYYLPESISGTKLLEGDPPKKYIISQEGVEQYSSCWRKMRVAMTDGAGKKHYSKPVKNKPSWVK